MTLAKGYEPYGEVLDIAGSASTAYGYNGEWTDGTGLVYLRSRYYDPGTGRFMTRDTWGGEMSQPMSYNAWLYSYANPVKLTDPSGQKAYFYNRQAAVNYALTWEKSYNFAVYGFPFGGGQGDCTNFVSQALKEGGMPEEEKWYFSSPGLPTTCNKYWFSPKCGEAWAVTQKLFEYTTIDKLFSHTDILGEDFEGRIIPKSPDSIPVATLRSTQSGDIVFYQQDENGGTFNHAVFVVGWGSLTEAGKNETHYELSQQAPLVVDHSGAYTSWGPHSLNDTENPVYKIVIVHVPGIIFSPNEIWWYPVICALKIKTLS